MMLTVVLYVIICNILLYFIIFIGFFTHLFYKLNLITSEPVYSEHDTWDVIMQVGSSHVVEGTIMLLLLRLFLYCHDCSISVWLFARVIDMCEWIS